MYKCTKNMQNIPVICYMIPDRWPVVHIVMWRSLWGWVGGCVSRVSHCCLGGFLSHWLTRAYMRFGVLYSGTLSARDVGVPRPAGSLTARVLGNGGSASSPAGQYLCLSSSHPLSVITWDCASLFLHRLISAEPRALAATHPLGHSPVFPHFRRKACLSR